MTDFCWLLPLSALRHTHFLRRSCKPTQIKAETWHFHTLSVNLCQTECANVGKHITVQVFTVWTVVIWLKWTKTLVCEWNSQKFALFSSELSFTCWKSLFRTATVTWIEITLQVWIDSNGGQILPEIDIWLWIPFMRGTSKLSNDEIQTWARQLKKGFTRGSMDKMWGELRWVEWNMAGREDR